MFNLKSDTPTIYWMYDGASEWTNQPLYGCIITAGSIKFDYSGDWDPKRNLNVFQPETDGFWHSRQRESGCHYWGVVARTDDLVVITGIWKEGQETGPFVIVIPH